MGVDDCALYPLFNAEVIQLMRDLVPPERQRAVGVPVVVTATLGSGPTPGAAVTQE